MATVLEIAKRVCVKIGLEQPDALYGATDREVVELADVINEAADEILDAADWQTLRTIETITGDAATLVWDVPSDFHRLLVDPELYSSEFETALEFISDENEWLRYQTQTYDSVINIWHLYQDQIHTDPALGSGTTAKYWYISSLAACLRVCVSACLHVCVSACPRVLVPACLRVRVSACLRVCVS
ncbi:MAG: hypothetical protein AAGB16_01000, partial [Pseudomonadota bacterium]